MSDLIAKGGRGNKAPYETTLVRVPLPIKPMVEKITAQWRKFFEQGSDEATNGAGEMLERVEAAIAVGTSKTNALLVKPVNKIDPHEVRDSQRLLATRDSVSAKRTQSCERGACALHSALLLSADRYLASLRLGKQAPEYKRAKQHIDAFIKELEKAEV